MEIYELLPVIELLEERAAEIIINEDRIRYKKFIETAENFIIDNHLIAVDSTIFDVPNKLDLVYSVYCQNAYPSALQLANLLYKIDPEGLGRYTTVQVKTVHQTFVISVDYRDLFIFMNTAYSKHKKLDEIIQTVEKVGIYTGRKIKCAEPIIQLTEIYTKLNDPAEVDEWRNLMHKEEILRKNINAEYIKKTIGGAVGGDFEDASTFGGNFEDDSTFGGDYNHTGEDGSIYNGTHNIVGEDGSIYGGRKNRNRSGERQHDNGGQRRDGQQSNKRPGRREFIEDFLKYMSSGNYVVVGRCALSLYGAPGPIKCLQVITSDFEGDKKFIHSHAARMMIKYEFPRVLHDSRHVKMRVYMDDRPILEIFNAGDFNLIPYNEFNTYDRMADAKNAIPKDGDYWFHELIKCKNVKIGSLFAVLRFASYDMWLYKCMSFFLTADKEATTKWFYDSVELFNAASDALTELYKVIGADISAMSSLFPIRQYIGKYTNAVVELKREGQKDTVDKSLYRKYMPVIAEINRLRPRENLDPLAFALPAAPAPVV